jgi:hypothetical protein
MASSATRALNFALYRFRCVDISPLLAASTLIQEHCILSYSPVQGLGYIIDIVLAASRGNIQDPTGGALHYYVQDKVRPYWARGGWEFILGDHTFVKLTER